VTLIGGVFMNTQEYVERWSGLMLEVVSGMAEWRQRHAKATLREIESEMDARWARARARMVEDLALDSTASDWGSAPRAEQPVCPKCGTELKAEGGKKERHLQTQGGEEIVLKRRYGLCATCGSGFFPPG
jgi:hypothetical protein